MLGMSVFSEKPTNARQTKIEMSRKRFGFVSWTFWDDKIFVSSFCSFPSTFNMLALIEITVLDVDLKDEVINFNFKHFKTSIQLLVFLHKSLFFQLDLRVY